MQFKLNNWFFIRDSISHLIFPEYCISCESELTKEEEHLCSFCLADLDFTHFEKFLDPTPLDQLFWGRSQVEATFSLIHFEKGKAAQNILHSLKYKHNPQIGVTFGEMIGRKLVKMTKFKDVDLLVPVPIHPKKRFVRGYNQSEELARGISHILSIPVESNFAQKRLHTKSQTQRGRFLRWDNVSDNFSILAQKSMPTHIAIVDDVITTGSTIEAFIRSIHEFYPELRVSVISLALTK